MPPRSPPAAILAGLRRFRYWEVNREGGRGQVATGDRTELDGRIGRVKKALELSSVEGANVAGGETPSRPESRLTRSAAGSRQVKGLEWGGRWQRSRSFVRTPAVLSV